MEKIYLIFSRDGQKLFNIKNKETAESICNQVNRIHNLEGHMFEEEVA